jgi:hemoglobin-like flavoprotein
MHRVRCEPNQTEHHNSCLLAMSVLVSWDAVMRAGLPERDRLPPSTVLEHQVSPEQKELVKQTWLKVAPMADAAARLFYDRLFEIDATTRPLFEATDLTEQRRKLIQALTMVVHGLDSLEALIPTIADLGRRHAQFGVTDAQYDAVGAALLWTLEQGLGSGWTPQMRVAWSGAYALLADVMRTAASAVSPPGQQRHLSTSISAKSFASEGQLQR